MRPGRITPGVVRIGNTVRRPASPGTSELLHLLEARGFAGAPRYLGLDEEGRDILSYLEGEVGAFQRWQNDQLAAFGRLLRAFHDATRSGPNKVICHHDPGPNNAVFQDNLPVALIDFDTAAPGSPLEDLGYAAWTWCIASKHNDPARQAAQVRALADAYDATPPQRNALVDAVLERQSRNVRFWTETSAAVTPEQRADRIAWSRREHDFTSTHRKTFEAHLQAAGLFEG
ncbi:aminoglycoside phosphotransferase family protein [Kribbella antibiotica]|uniref:Aminoglycoside phosphotransferase family protein n=1 Tax=Kribbella antibiotica TaxID=190195 RepID=A0A4R4Z8P3_9ACTN|nr:phosphotransferase [Kribbella antibiotica]TDD53459.1 aminoglycoside phosphotransferase family protein [Kribbella antibiotica]